MPSTLDIASLYPVVHDLTDAEYAGDQETWCQNPELSSLFGGYFSVLDLVRPVENPRPASSMRTTAMAERCRPENSRRVLPRHRSLEREVPDDHWEDSFEHDGISSPQRLVFHDIYVLTRQIYRGHYSTVWETIHRTSGTRYATKIFDRRMLSPKEDGAAKREVIMLKQLGDKATGTISLVDSFEDPAHFFLVMDYVEGSTLQSQVLHKKFSEKETRKLAKSLLQGVGSLHHHDRPICHRNLKPDNILLSHDGNQVTIADFGWSVVVPESNSGRGSLTGRCGSVTYAAPEVQQLQSYGTKSDMWSVGAILYFSIAGQSPFVHRTKRGVQRKIIKGDYSFSSKRWTGVSHSAKRFIAALLQVEPSLRLDAIEALNHPWIAMSGTLSPIKEETPKHIPTLGRVLKSLHESSQSTLDVDDESCSSHTVSLASTEADEFYSKGRVQHTASEPA